MIVARSLEEVSRQDASVVTVGSFDGVHLGHVAIIKSVRERSRVTGCRGVVVTFDPHPREVVGRGNVEYLTTIEERLTLLEQHGIALAVVVPFTYEFSRMTPDLFYREIVAGRIGVREVIVGHDHMFGRDRKAGFHELQEIGVSIGFTATEVEPVYAGETLVNSSAIRTLLRNGDVESAASLLGRPYALHGSIVRGAGRGTLLGFPTANIRPDTPKKLVPAGGVYVVRVQSAEGTDHGMMNIGTRPTFETAGERVLEVHLVSSAGGGYGSDIEVRFLKRLRDEQRFPSKEELVEQLKRDRRQCLDYLEHKQS